MNKREKLVLNIKKRKLCITWYDITKTIDLTKKEVMLLALLSNNNYTTLEDIASFIYEIKSYSDSFDNMIRVLIYRLRKKGLDIETRYHDGYILRDDVFIDY